MPIDVATILVPVLIAVFFGLLLVTLPTCLIYKKAGQPWWAALVPVYNSIILFKIADRPWWWIFFTLIPITNVVIMIIAYVDFIKNFGKPGVHVLLWLFIPIVYRPYLAFSSAIKYKEHSSEETYTQ